MLMTQPGNKAEPQARIRLVLKGKDHRLGPCYPPSIGLPRTSLAREGQMSICLRRREFIAGLGGVAAACPLAAGAQQGDRVRRIGVLISGATKTIPWRRLSSLRSRALNAR